MLCLFKVGTLPHYKSCSTHFNTNVHIPGWIFKMLMIHMMYKVIYRIMSNRVWAEKHTLDR